MVSAKEQYDDLKEKLRVANYFLNLKHDALNDAHYEYDRALVFRNKALDEFNKFNPNKESN